MEILLNALAMTRDASAILLALVILVIVPKAMVLFSAQAERFSREMEAERGAHRAENQLLSSAVNGLARETRTQTRELMKQTYHLRGLRKDIATGDLPLVPGPAKPDRPGPADGATSSMPAGGAKPIATDDLHTADVLTEGET